MKKTFRLLVDGEKIPFFSVFINPETGLATNEEQQNKLVALESNADIVDISHLSYRPENGSVYSPELRDFPESDKSKSVDFNGVEVKSFVYLIDNVSYGCFYIRPGTEKMDLLIAALGSNPEIVLETR